MATIDKAAYDRVMAQAQKEGKGNLVSGAMQAGGITLGNTSS